jgi:hypothetical protein
MSFDLCDNPLGVGVSQTMNDPDMLARFGYGDGVRGPETIESRLEATLNGSAAKTTNGTETAEKTASVTETAVETANGTDIASKTVVV